MDRSLALEAYLEPIPRQCAMSLMHHSVALPVSWSIKILKLIMQQGEFVEHHASQNEKKYNNTQCCEWQRTSSSIWKSSASSGLKTIVGADACVSWNDALGTKDGENLRLKIGLNALRLRNMDNQKKKMSLAVQAIHIYYSPFRLFMLLQIKKVHFLYRGEETQKTLSLSIFLYLELLACMEK